MRAIKATNASGNAVLAGLVGFGAMCLFGYVVVIATLVAVAVLLVVLVVQFCRAAPPAPKQYDRVDDDAARAHRARMAAIRDGRTAARFEGQARISNRR